MSTGNFGCVYKGFLKKPEDKFELVVAVKTIISKFAYWLFRFLNKIKKSPIEWYNVHTNVHKKTSGVRKTYETIQIHQPVNPL